MCHYLIIIKIIIFNANRSVMWNIWIIIYVVFLCELRDHVAFFTSTTTQDINLHGINIVYWPPECHQIIIKKHE